jgi:hypothetical protein
MNLRRLCVLNSTLHLEKSIPLGPVVAPATIQSSARSVAFTLEHYHTGFKMLEEAIPHVARLNG